MNKRLITMYLYAGIVEERPYIGRVDDNYGHANMPALFTSRKKARERFEKVKRVRVDVFEQTI
jgi:hypothetical protein